MFIAVALLSLVAQAGDATPAPAPTKPSREKLIVLEVKAADDAAKPLAAQVLEQVLTELSQDGRYEVLSTSDIQQLLGLERQKQLLGCSDDSTSCGSEITDALGAPWMLSGTIGKTDSQVRVDLKIVATAKATVTARAGKVCTQSTLFTTVTEVVEALLQQMPRAGGAAVPDVKGVAQSTVAMLTNPEIGIELKRAALKRAADGQSDLTSFIDAVQPPKAAEALCADFHRRVVGLPASVTAFDSFKDPVEGTLVSGSIELGKIPYEGVVPACVRRFQLKRDGVIVAEHELTLSRSERNVHVFRLPGRPTRWALSVLGDLVPRTTNLGLGVGPAPGVGLQLDYWGKAFHFTLAAKANEGLFKPVNRDSTWLPGGDLFFGLTTGLGEGPRVHLAFDLGLWSYGLPAARTVVALNVGDRLFVSVAATLAYYLWALPMWANLDRSYFFVVNLSATVGVAF